MAYCKSCGNPLKDGEHRCKNCGADVEQLETVDDSQVEIIRHGGSAKKRVIRFCNDDYDEETVANTFRVFDRKALLMLFAMTAVFTLAFFVQTVDNEGLSTSNAIQTCCVAAALLLLLTAYVLHNRGLLMLGLTAVSFALAVCAAVTFVYFKTSDGNAILLSCIQGFLLIVLSAMALTMFLEMATGKRRLGFHCFLTVASAISVLGHITLSLVVNINSDVGIIMTAWQILAVSAKILLLSTVLILFANMAHISVDERY